MKCAECESAGKKFKGILRPAKFYHEYKSAMKNLNKEINYHVFECETVTQLMPTPKPSITRYRCTNIPHHEWRV